MYVEDYVWSKGWYAMKQNQLSKQQNDLWWVQVYQ